MPGIYKVTLSPAAWRALQELPASVQARIMPRIDALALTPRPVGVVKLSGDLASYRLRVGAYRVLYEVHDDALLVLVLRIGHRGGVYRRR